MKRRYIFLLIGAVLCVGLCICLQVVYQNMLADDSDHLEALRDSIKEYASNPDATASPDFTGSITKLPDPPTISAVDTVASETTSASETSSDTGSATVSPLVSSSIEMTQTTQLPLKNPGAVSLDFDRLREVNPEIHAWLEIKNTLVDYPVLQSTDNDKKYLSTAYNGSPYVGGAIYTEKTYNCTDFNDPVTLIYGHTMPWGILFGQLQQIYSVSSTFEQYKNITLYLPDEVRNYVVFAAVPYEKIHILHTYDFSNAYWYDNFFDGVRNIRAIGANIAEERFPESDDHVIILSVCLNEDTTKRFLVMAVLDEDLADNIN